MSDLVKMAKIMKKAGLEKKAILKFLAPLFKKTITQVPAKAVARRPITSALKGLGVLGGAGAATHYGLKSLGEAGLGLPRGGGLDELIGRGWLGGKQYDMRQTLNKALEQGKLSPKDFDRYLATPGAFSGSGAGMKFNPSGFHNIKGKEFALPSNLQRFGYESPSFLSSPLETTLPSWLVGAKGRGYEGMGPEQALEFAKWQGKKMKGMEPKYKAPQYTDLSEIYRKFPNAGDPAQAAQRQRHIDALMKHERAQAGMRQQQQQLQQQIEKWNKPQQQRQDFGPSSYDFYYQ